MHFIKRSISTGIACESNHVPICLAHTAQVFLAAGSDVGGDYAKAPPALYFDGMKVQTADCFDRYLEIFLTPPFLSLSFSISLYLITSAGSAYGRQYRPGNGAETVGGVGKTHGHPFPGHREIDNKGLEKRRFFCCLLETATVITQY